MTSASPAPTPSTCSTACCAAPERATRRVGRTSAAAVSMPDWRTETPCLQRHLCRRRSPLIPQTLRLAPVVIFQGASDTGSDVLMVMNGASGYGEVTGGGAARRGHGHAGHAAQHDRLPCRRSGHAGLGRRVPADPGRCGQAALCGRSGCADDDDRVRTDLAPGRRLLHRQRREHVACCLGGTQRCLDFLHRQRDDQSTPVRVDRRWRQHHAGQTRPSAHRRQRARTAGRRRPRTACAVRHRHEWRRNPGCVAVTCRVAGTAPRS